MTLFAVATVPGILILFFVYFKDPVEKEPLKLLLSLFALGCVSTVPAIILELIGSTVLFDGGSPTTLLGIILDNFIVVALVEELCKFIFLRLKTWKSPEFNYLFDGIVYAVFVSLGFAVLENIFYVFEFGIETGIARAFTSLPGHTVFAVFMGFFYAHAKLEQIKGNNAGVKQNLALAVVVPTLAHGAYDFLATLESDVAFLLFLVLITVMFITGLRLIFRESEAAARLYATEPFAGVPFAASQFDAIKPGIGNTPAAPYFGAGPTFGTGNTVGSYPTVGTGTAGGTAGGTYPVGGTTVGTGTTPQAYQIQCPNCRSWVLPGGHYCQNCGTKIG